MESPAVAAKLRPGPGIRAAQRPRGHAYAGRQRQVPHRRRARFEDAPAHRRRADRPRTRRRARRVSVIDATPVSAALATPASSLRPAILAVLHPRRPRLPRPLWRSLDETAPGPAAAPLPALPRRLHPAGRSAGHRPKRPATAHRRAGTAPATPAAAAATTAGRPKPPPTGPGRHTRTSRWARRPVAGIDYVGNRRRPAVRARQRQDRSGRSLQLHLPALRPVRTADPRLEAKQPADVKFTPVAGLVRRLLEPYAKAFYAAESLGAARQDPRSDVPRHPHRPLACRCRVRTRETDRRVLRQVRRRSGAVRQHHVQLRGRRQGQARQPVHHAQSASKARPSDRRQRQVPRDRQDPRGHAAHHRPPGGEGTRRRSGG